MLNNICYDNIKESSTSLLGKQAVGLTPQEKISFPCYNNIKESSPSLLGIQAVGLTPQEKKSFPCVATDKFAWTSNG